MDESNVAQYIVATYNQPFECDMHWRDNRYFIPAGERVHERASDSFAACGPCAGHFDWPTYDQQLDGAAYWGPEK